MGQGVAALNAALLLEKFDIFRNEHTLIGELASQVFDQKSEIRDREGRLQETKFQINKQLAFRYLQIALHQKEVEDEASLKIADFLYYGSSGVQDLAQAL